MDVRTLAHGLQCIRGMTTQHNTTRQTMTPKERAEYIARNKEFAAANAAQAAKDEAEYQAALARRRAREDAAFEAAMSDDDPEAEYQAGLDKINAALHCEG
jgi:hypothetical protein